MLSRNVGNQMHSDAVSYRRRTVVLATFPRKYKISLMHQILNRSVYMTCNFCSMGNSFLGFGRVRSMDRFSLCIFPFSNCLQRITCLSLKIIIILQSTSNI